jgi:ribosomal protein L37E
VFKLISMIPVESRKTIGDSALGVAALTGMFGLLGIMGAVMPDESVESPLTWLAFGLALEAVALVCVLVKLRLATLGSSSLGHLSKYEAILTGVEQISIQEVAGIVNSKPKRVQLEIQSLINSGAISDFYIDHGREQIVSKKYTPKTSSKTVETCGRCGHANDLIVGITKHCAHCGTMLAVDPRSRKPRSEWGLPGA